MAELADVSSAAATGRDERLGCADASMVAATEREIDDMIGGLVETVHVSCDSLDALAAGADERPESADVSSPAATGREDGKIVDLEETVRVACEALAVGADEQSEFADPSMAAATEREVDGKIGGVVEMVHVGCDTLVAGADERPESADESSAAATGREVDDKIGGLVETVRESSDALAVGADEQSESADTSATEREVDGKIGGVVEMVHVSCDALEAGADERPESADVSSAAATGSEDVKIGDLVEAVRGSCEALAIGADERSELYVTAAAVAAAAGSSKRGADEYVTARRRLLEQLRSKFGSEAEYETEKSREHWTVVGRPCSDLELQHVANQQHFKHLVNQDAIRLRDAHRSLRTRPQPRRYKGSNTRKLLKNFEKHSFFVDYGDELVVGEKIGEGGQAEIFNATIRGKDEYVLKVFKLGFALAHLERQWTVRARNGVYHKENIGTFCCFMEGGTLLRDGRFAFVMRRYWGDLRKLIDQKNQDNNGMGFPFPLREAFKILYFIARGMAYLHDEGILHRDLKASNVLIRSIDGVPSDYHIADFECSIGVHGTGFWRAPEVLQALKIRVSDWTNIWTEKVDVYSYAMTSYEILTGGIPFGDLACIRQNYDAVIGGERPQFPDHVDGRIQELLTRCWHSDPLKRPSFHGILEELLVIELPVMEPPVIELPVDKLLATTQHWYGHWMMGSHQRVMTTELFFAANNKIYGGGNDKVGESTWTGMLNCK
jgi:hypothetical protein